MKCVVKGCRRKARRWTLLWPAKTMWCIQPMSTLQATDQWPIEFRGYCLKCSGELESRFPEHYHTHPTMGAIQ